MYIKRILLVLCGLLAIGFSVPREPITMAKADGEENRIWLNTQENVVENKQYSAIVYLNTCEEISALSIEIHFNPDVLSINNTHNSIDSGIYDSSIHEESITYSYVFSSVTLNSNQQLFYFYYQIADGVVPGTYYFDVIVSEAYNSSLESVEIVTSRKYINVIDESSLKNSRAYVSGSSLIYTSCNETFSFSYYLNNSEPSSGTFVIRYDDTLFEFVSFTKLNFFDNMICDYNSSMKGEILVSFAETTSDDNTNLFTIELRAIKNVDTLTQISLLTNELYDTDMNPMGFYANNLSVIIKYNSSLAENPRIYTSAVVDTLKRHVILTIYLEENSQLGAGDFVLKFDKNILKYETSKKLISPTFFSINDKDSQLTQGQIKFSILSTTNITIGSEILRVTFSYTNSLYDRNSSVVLTGSGVTDSLTNPIELDISGTYFTILGVDLVTIWIDSYLYMNDPSFAGEGTGRCVSDNLYKTAKEELLKLDEQSIEDFETDYDNKYTLALERYLAWANANHDDSPFESNYEFLNNSSSCIPTIKNNSESLALIILMVLVFTTGGITFTYFRRKKSK